jgi:kynurenine formamidase
MGILLELGRVHDMRGCAVVFKTGYCDAFMGREKRGGGASNSAFSVIDGKTPHITLDVAQLLIRQSVAMIGVDALGFEPPDSTQFEVNRLFCDNEIFVLEGLCRLSEIPSSVFLLEAYPLAILGVEGSPCRAVALVPPVGDSSLTGGTTRLKNGTGTCG